MNIIYSPFWGVGKTNVWNLRYGEDTYDMIALTYVNFK